MPEDYQDIVLAAYKKKCDTGGLSLILSKPTTAKLKKECLRIYDKRYSPEDDDILSTFFNVDKIGNDFRKIISSADTGVFRPLLNHLKNDRIKTHERNSELLAWLIDFKPRPSFLYYKSLTRGQQEEAYIAKENNETKTINKTNKPLTIEENEVNNLASNQSQETTDEEKDKPTIPIISVLETSKAKADIGNEDVQNSAEIINTSKDIQSPPQRKPLRGSRKHSFLIHKIIISGVVILAIGISGFLFWQDKIDRETITKDEKCMYWAGDHYEAIVCNQETSTPKITLNVERLRRLKKINSPDKLNKEDLGKVWYAKRYGKVEFYTDSGKHPIDTNKVLKPLTDYILSHHISYERYLLHLLLWAIGGCISLMILVVLARKCLFKKKYPNRI